MNNTMASEISILSGIIFMFAALGISLFTFLMLWESAFKKKRPKWVYGATMASLGLSWIGALTLIVLIASALSPVHKVLNIIFIVAAAALFLLIGHFLKKNLIKEHSIRDAALQAAFMIFTVFVCLSYIWSP